MSDEDGRKDELPPPSRKRLKSSEPDLDVVVGEDDNQKVFSSYSMILAGHSEYIDAMLSAPMKEQADRKITFPDITPEFWEKLMKFLEPGGALGLAVVDGLELLPFLDKYGFRSSLASLDTLFLPVLTRFADTGESGYLTSVTVSTAALSFQANLPLCKPKAVECADRLFKLHGKDLCEDQIRSLVPLVQNSDDTLLFFSTLMRPEGLIGNQTGGRGLSLEADFAARFRTRCREVDQQREIFHRLDLCDVKVLCSGCDIANGEYERVESDFDGLPSERLGLLGRHYSRRAEREGFPPARLQLAPMDPFGLRWELFIVEDDGTRKVLFFWARGYSSPIPPSHGWLVGKHGSSPLPEFRYDFGSGYE